MGFRIEATIRNLTKRDAVTKAEYLLSYTRDNLPNGKLLSKKQILSKVQGVYEEIRKNNLIYLRNTTPVENNERVAYQMMLNSIGWCDQFSLKFMRN